MTPREAPCPAAGKLGALPGFRELKLIHLCQDGAGHPGRLPLLVPCLVLRRALCRCFCSCNKSIKQRGCLQPFDCCARWAVSTPGNGTGTRLLGRTSFVHPDFY